MLKTYTKEPDRPAIACVIWMHGLGADAANMMGVADVFPDSATPIRHVFVDAPIRPVSLNNNMPMRAWYNLSGLTLQDRDDREGILQSEQEIETIIAEQLTQGFQPNQIYLAGFSQGGAMALFIGLRAQHALGGVIALSAYLPQQADCLVGGCLSLPIFMAMGTLDPIVIPAWTKLSYDFVLSRGFHQVCWKEYNIEHTICIQEIVDLSRWLEAQITTTIDSGDRL